MNLLVLLLFMRIYQPKYNKIIYFWAYIVTTIVYIVVNVLVAKLGMPWFNVVYTTIYINVLCFVMFECDYKKSFIVNELFILFGLIAEVLTTGFCTIISNNSYEYVLGSVQYIAVSCLANILILVVIWRVFTLLLSKNEQAALKLRQIIFFLIFTVFEVYSICTFAFKIENSVDGIQTIIMLLGFVFLNIYIVYFIDKTTMLYKKQNEYNLMQKQNQIQLDNFREISRRYEESKKTIHDIKKHLNSLSALEHIDKERAEEYESIIEQKVDSLFYEFHCSNQLLSIIMSQKITICKNEGIDVKTQIEDISFDFIEDFDITAIYANLWDNAIEACRKVKQEERFINILIGRVNDFIVISFENSFNGVINKKCDVLQSTKKNHDGVGWTIIKSAVEKYRGFVNASNDEKTFTVQIMFPVES